MSLPAFIPRDQVKPGVEYRGYVSTSRGLLRKDLAHHKGTVASGTAGFKRLVNPPPGKTGVPVAHNDWGVEPTRRRTPQQRLESLASRIFKQVNEGTVMNPVQKGEKPVWARGLPESIGQDSLRLMEKVGREGLSQDAVRDIQALAARTGQLMTFEQCKALASLYLKNAEKEWNASNDKRVTSKSPYTLDRS